MRYLYTCMLWLLTPYFIIRLYWKSRKLSAYRSRILERFCLNQSPEKRVDIWVHAVSLGEVRSIVPLIESLLTASYRVLLTTMTPTGSECVLKHFGQRVLHQYFPYDIPWVLKRFFKRFKPKLGLIIETELWPNLIVQAQRANVRLLLGNARISDGAFKQYKRVSFFFRPILQCFEGIFTQSEEDSQKFVELGAHADCVHTFGNLKFDQDLSQMTLAQMDALSNRWGEGRKVIIAASTHEDEERQLLHILPELKAAIPDLLFLIAPRHPERFHSVYQTSLELGWQSGLKSDLQSIHPKIDVVIIDTLGDLMSLYPYCHYAFVGGSLVPVGGHNVLEPIVCNVPVFCGKYMQNSKAIVGALIKAEAIQIIAEAGHFSPLIVEMEAQPELRLAQIARAQDVLIKNRGTSTRYLEIVKTLLPLS